MGRKLGAYTNIAVFCALLFVCLFAPSCVDNFFKDSFQEFKAPLSAVPSHMRDLQKYWSLSGNSKRTLIDVGVGLSRMNANNELNNIRYKSLEAKLATYQDLLGLPSYTKYRTEIARVSSRSMTAWWQIMEIRKGKFHGIKEGSAVIYGGGVVGRVIEVNLYTSTVELVSSPDFRMAAHFEGDDRTVIYQGFGAKSFREATGTVKDVPKEIRASAAAPLKLVTSSMAGIFPEGILIGTIADLPMDVDGIFRSGIVELSAKLANLTEVAVLVPLNEEEQ